jgi:hypothetical protein
LEAVLGAGLATTLELDLATGFEGPLGATFATGLAAGLATGLATGLADLVTTGLPLATAFAGEALAGEGLEAFLAGAATLAFELLVELIFFAAVFELVLRGFFTSCLLAVAAYAPLQVPAIGK